MKRKPRWTLEILTGALAVLCGLLFLVLLVQRPAGWPVLAVLVVLWGIGMGLFRYRLRSWLARWVTGGSFENSKTQYSLESLSQPAAVLSGETVLWYNTAFRQRLLGGEDRLASRAQKLLQRRCVPCAAAQQKVPGVENAHDVVEVLAVHREAGQAGAPDPRQDLRIGVGQAHRLHVGGMGHGVTGNGVAEIEHIFDPLFFLPLDGALFLAQVHHHADLLFGDRFLLGLGLHMQKAQHAVGGSGQKPDDRPHDHRQPVHHPAGEACHRQRLLHGDALGHQLAQNQRKIRQNDGDDDDRQRVQRAGGKRPEAQVLIHPVHQVFGKAVRRESAAQKARQRDADLNGGQKARGRLHHFQKPPGLCVAFLRHSPQLGRVQRNDRDLRHGEKRVEKN